MGKYEGIEGSVILPSFPGLHHTVTLYILRESNDYKSTFLRCSFAQRRKEIPLSEPNDNCSKKKKIVKIFVFLSTVEMLMYSNGIVLGIKINTEVVI